MDVANGTVLRYSEQPSGLVGRAMDTESLEVRQSEGQVCVQQQLGAALQVLTATLFAGRDEPFTHAVARALMEALEADWAVVGRMIEPGLVRAAMAVRGQPLIEEITYRTDGTPCQEVLTGDMCTYERGVADLFPEDQLLIDWGVEGYCGMPLFNSTGEVMGHVAVLTRQPLANGEICGRLLPLLADRTAAEIEREAAVAALKESENRFRCLVERASEIIAVQGVDTRIRYLSPGIQTVLGYSAAELVQQTGIDYVHPDDQVRLTAELAHLVGRPDAALSVSYRARHRDGHWVYLEGSVTNLTEHPAVRGLVVNVHDVTERRAAQLAAEEREQRLRLITDQVPGCLWTADSSLRLTYSAGSALRALDVEPHSLEGRLLHEVLPSGDDGAAILRAHHQALRGASAEARLEWKGRTLQLRIEPLRDTEGAVIGTVGFGLDITDRLQLEASLIQAQKMEAIGLLAGGIAHDFNNVLAVINGYSELLLAQLAPDDPHRPSLEQVSAAGERAVCLTRQLLAFSRKQLLEPQRVNLPAVLQQLCHMVQRLIGEDIRLHFTAEADPCCALLDPNQLEQVVLNLVVNARDAMPAGGDIYLRVENALGPGNAGQPGILITVRDTGCGMDANTLARIWEPFFTTKPLGVGTGLGLPTAYGIVQQSGGTIEVRSAPGRGTTFTLWFPACEDEGPCFAPPFAQAAAAGGAVNILLVEDEEMVREFLTTALSMAGHRVSAAGDGERALEMVRRGDTPVDLLLTDVVMPGLSGSELADRLQELRPGLPVLYMSGHAEDEVLRRRVSAEQAHFIHKPFSIPELLSRISALVEPRADVALPSGID